jgi:hypothetical protein
MGQVDLALFLGNCHHSTISRWETGDLNVPAWVAERMLLGAEAVLPLELTQKLLTHAQRHNLSFRGVLSRAITEYLRKA